MWGGEGGRVLGDVGKGQECACRSHRRAEWGRTCGTQLGRGPCPVHQQRREAPGGDSREGARWVCPWCGGATGKAPTMGQGPTGSKSRGFPCFHDSHSISGPTLCGSPNSPQTWLRPPVLTPMTGKQLIKEGLLAGPPGSASPWASRPRSGRVAVGPRNASGVSTRGRCHGRATPFLCPSLLEGWGQAQGGPGFLWPSCCLREVHSQKSMVQEPQGCCNSGNISLEAGGAWRARAQCAAGTGGRSLGWDAPPFSGDFQGRRIDCSWKSTSVPLGAAPEEAAAPCPQRVPGAFQSRGQGGLPRQSNGSDATLPVRDSQVELVVKNPVAKARDARDTGSIPGSGRSPWRRKWQEFQEILA